MGKDKEEKPPKENDLGTDLQINKYRLDEEAVKQASLYHYWADKLAGARASLDTASDALKLVSAEVEMTIRQDAEEGKIKIKTTEGVVAALKETDSSVQEARKDLREAQELVYHLEAAVKAFEHRKSEIDNLTQLWRGAYYAKPDGGPNGGSANDAASRDVRSGLNKSKGE